MILSLKGVLSELSIWCTETVPESITDEAGSVETCGEEWEPIR